MQRLMQALGAYGKLGHLDQRTHFLEHIPTAVTRLREDHVARRSDNSRQLWGLMSFSLWLEQMPRRSGS